MKSHKSHSGLPGAYSWLLEAEGRGGADFLSAASHVAYAAYSQRKASQDGWIVVVQAASSGRVEQSLLCNFLSDGIGQALDCWRAQHNNLTSIICLSESAVAACRTFI